MNKRAFCAAVVCALCGIATPHHAISLRQLNATRLGPAAIWRPAPGQLVAIRSKCMRGDSARVGDCFISEMRAAGASPEAVAFAKSLADKGYGYLRDFRAEGRVDVAYVEYFLGANELEGVLLVNGSPPILEVDDLDLFPSDEVAKNGPYRGLLQRYPKLGVFPGDRFHTDVPVAKSLGGRGQEFIVSYVLRDGCHACAVIGELRLAFDFDADGTFTGVQVLEVTPHIQSTAKYLFRETEQAVVLAF